MTQEVSTSPPASEPVQPEPISQPAKGGKKKSLLLMIVAIIVAVALISTAAIVMLLPKDVTLTLETEINPSGAITIPAGATFRLAVNSTLVNEKKGIEHDIDSWTNVTYRWSKSPDTLGTFDVVAKRTAVLTAAKSAMTGTVSCKVTYGDQEVVVEADVTVSAPFLDRVSVTPSTRTIEVDEPLELTASATDSVGDPITGATFTWSVWNLSADDYTLSSTTGTSVTFTAHLEDAEAFVNATATVGTVTKTGTALIKTGEIGGRTVDYYFYDMFDVPFGEWWHMRNDTYGEEQPVSDSYPYIYKWFGAQEGNFWWYTNMRMTLTGRNMPELNMQENAEFLPFLGTARGGTAKIDWYMQYLTEEEMSRYPDATASWLDGWVVSLNGTVTLDEQAAMTVLGVTADGLDNFASWWTNNNASVNLAYLDWVMYEGGKNRLDIYNMYEYPLTFMTHQIWAEKVGDEVILHYDTVSWGMEALMTRWMREAFMPTEWYFEDMYFNAVIGPESADLDVDTVAVYAMYAYETTNEGEPCWMWESLLQDYVPSSRAHPVSDYDPYQDKTYLMLSPGSPLYGEWMIYDYAPGAWNLSEGETLSLTWPAGEQMFYRHGGDDLVYEEYAAIRVDYAEPMGSDFPDNVVIDSTARLITYTGPIDMWTWSKDQTEHENLADEWDRLGLLPYGMPTIEFSMAGPVRPSSFEVVVSPDEVELEEAVEVTVTVYDQYGDLYPDYTGTVEFTSTDPSALLPVDYEFVAGDEGTKTFWDVSFGTSGPQTITVRDVDVASLFGDSNVVTVLVAPYAQELEVSGVTTPILKGTASDFTVRVLDQNGDLFPGYTGTVTFSSNDTEATLPAPYEFVAGDAGVKVFTAGVVFDTVGWHDLTAVDDSDPVLTGMQADILVLGLHFEATYVPSTVIANETVVTLTVSVKDQYGDLYEGYEGTVVFESDDQYEVLPDPAEFTPADAGEKEVTGLMLGMPGSRTVTMTDQDEEDFTGSVSIVVSPMAKATTLELTEVSETCMPGEPETAIVTIYDQYGRVFAGYSGTVHFSSSDLAAELPGDYTFDPGTDAGTHEFTSGVTFNTLGDQTLTCEDTEDSSVSDTVDVLVTDVPPEIASFVVEGITSGEWAGNVSTVKVTAIDQFDNVMKKYVGTVTFSTNAAEGTYELPDDYTFLLADDGVKTLSPVRFDVHGTYSVTVSDTVVTTATGTQSGIVVAERPVADAVELSGYPTEVDIGDPFSITVTVKDQWGDVHVWYTGTVGFTSSDLAATLPADYTFTPSDEGVHVFTGVALNTAGSQTVTVTDTEDSAVTATTDAITVTEPPLRMVEYSIYDMFKEPWGQWWTDPTWGRIVSYFEEPGDETYILTSGEYNTMVFWPDVRDYVQCQAMVYAPYRLAIDAVNLDGLTVSQPEFMPISGTGGEGAQVELNMYMQYLNTDWWTSSEWTGFTGFEPEYFPKTSGGSAAEGYHLGTIYDVLMNRAAAELWLGMPLGADPATWWTDNKATYVNAWNSWVLSEGNTRLDIYNGYADLYYSEKTWMDMAVEGSDVRLKIGHVSWGFEVLMCRWLSEANVIQHQPWYEDLSLSVTYGDEMSDLTMDAVCQWSLLAVKSNGSTTAEPAWAWQPVRIDYIESSMPKHPNSEYDPYKPPLSYQSWNAGDELFEMPVNYDTTPGVFNLAAGETLTIQLPTDTDVLGYEGRSVPGGTHDDVLYDDNIAAYEDLMVYGSMELGYYVTNPSSPIDLSSMYNPATKTLTIAGPKVFDQVRHTGGQLYHGAPWIEFDIVTTKAMQALAPEGAEASEPSVASAASVVPSGTSAAAETMSMMAVVAAAVLTVAALGCNVRRRPA